MVSFSCDQCGDIIKKPKVKTHQQMCWTSGFSCVDCNGHFNTTEVNEHNQCVSEEQRYAGKWLEKQAALKKGKGGEKKEGEKRKRSPVKELSSPEWTPENKPAKAPKVEKKVKKEKKDKKKEAAPTPITITVKVGKTKVAAAVPSKEAFEKSSEAEKFDAVQAAIAAAVKVNIAKIVSDM